MIDDSAEHQRLQSENQRLKSSVRELAVLNEISSVITSTMTSEEISQKVIKKAVAAVAAAEAAIFTFSAEAMQTPVTFVRGRATSRELAKTRLDIRIAGWIAKNKKPLVINDVAQDPMLRDLQVDSGAMKSILAVPLTAKGKLLGALAAFNSQRPTGFNEDDTRLLTIIGAHAAQILENSRLYQEALQLQKLQGELAAANKIQTGFLPAGVPRLPGYDIYGGSVAANEVGGDFYDFVAPAPDRLFFTVGDVSGKGLPAALLMATIQGQTRLLINRDPALTPPDILDVLNIVTCRYSHSAQFVTMIAGVIDATGDDITIANGGHPFPIIVRRGGQVEEVTESSLIVGVLGNTAYAAARCRLAVGDLMALASDGIDEAMNGDGDQFGLDRFKAVLTDNVRLSASQIYEAVMRAVIAFRGRAEQSDDATLMIIKRTDLT